MSAGKVKGASKTKSTDLSKENQGAYLDPTVAADIQKRAADFSSVVRLLKIVEGGCASPKELVGQIKVFVHGMAIILHEYAEFESEADRNSHVGALIDLWVYLQNVDLVSRDRTPEDVEKLKTKFKKFKDCLEPSFMENVLNISEEHIEFFGNTFKTSVMLFDKLLE